MIPAGCKEALITYTDAKGSVLFDGLSPEEKQQFAPPPPVNTDNSAPTEAPAPDPAPASSADNHTS